MRDLHDVLLQPPLALLLVVPVALVLFRQTVSIAVNIPAFALHSQQSYFLLAFEAPPCVLLNPLAHFPLGFFVFLLLVLLDWLLDGGLGVLAGVAA